MGYADAQEGAISRTAFRSAEKKYKRYTHLSSAKSRNQRSRRYGLIDVILWVWFRVVVFVPMYGTVGSNDDFDGVSLVF
jgi:ABC-type Fe3+ transport system permease subunit